MEMTESRQYGEPHACDAAMPVAPEEKWKYKKYDEYQIMALCGRVPCAAAQGHAGQKLVLASRFEIGL